MNARWRSVVIIGLAYVLASVDIGAASTLFPVLRKNLALSTTWLGVFASTGLIARAVFGPIWGILADRFGRKRMLTVAVLGWSAWVLATGLAQSWWQFLCLYSVAVIGAVGVEPLADSFLSDLFLPGQRGLAFGVLRAILGFGLAIAVPALGWVVAAAGTFRAGFLLLGALQVTIGVVLVAGTAEPAMEGENSVELRPRRPKLALAHVGALLRIPTVCLLAINYALATSIVLLMYLPTFLTEGRGFSVPTATRLYGLMHVGAVAGAVIGGQLGDWMERRRPYRGRVQLMQAYLVAFAVLTLLIFQARWHSAIVGGTLLVVFGTLLPIGFAGCVLPMLSLVVPPAMRSTGFALLASFIQGASLTVTSLAVGAAADRHGLARALFWATTVPYALNAVVWFGFYSVFRRDVENTYRLSLAVSDSISVS